MLEKHIDLTEYILSRLTEPFGQRPGTGWEEHRWYDRTIIGRLDRRIDQWRAGEETDEDFVPLLGQFVRYLGLGAQVAIRLHASQNEPDWSRFGLRVVSVELGGHEMVVECALDDLGWITPQQADSIRKACRQGIAEGPGPVAGDSWLLGTKHGRDLPEDRVPTYKTAGQRELLRAVDRMPPGDVLIGSLTTGEGKSLVIHRLVTKDPRKLTLVVVPTVALAIDQELEARQVVGEDLLGHPLAYIGGQDQEQACIRERIQNGTQRVIFTCPESLRGLMTLLRQAAKDGLMAALIVDEAHVIATDGWQFRPDFAWIPSMCVALSRGATGSASPPRFVLLSATLTQPTCDALERWFGRVGQGPVQIAGSLRLRGELTSICEQIGREAALTDREQRMRRLRDIATILPRPFYVYATTPADVQSIGVLLREIGMKRVDQVHGGTQTRQRKDVIRRLKSGLLDAVSANSAFGLGLNVSDVRAVIHACVPDGLDRYYQEIGRGGRDGRHALAWWMWCRSDIRVAENQAFVRVLNEAGFPRWSNMWRQRRASPHSPDSVWLPIAGGEIVEPNERHKDWDTCCLVLMEAAGLLEFVWDVSPPEGVDRSRSLCVRKLTADSLSDPEEWKAKTEQVRARIRSASRTAFESMVRVLNKKTSLWQALAEVYGINTLCGGLVRPKLCRDSPSSDLVLLPTPFREDAPDSTHHGYLQVCGSSVEFVVSRFDSLLRWQPICNARSSIMRLVVDYDVEAEIAPLVRRAFDSGVPLQLQFVNEDASVVGEHLVRIWSHPVFDGDMWHIERGEAATSLLVLPREVAPPIAHHDIRNYLMGLEEYEVDFLSVVKEKTEAMEDFF